MSQLYNTPQQWHSTRTTRYPCTLQTRYTRTTQVTCHLVHQRKQSPSPCPPQRWMPAHSTLKHHTSQHVCTMCVLRVRSTALGWKLFFPFHGHPPTPRLRSTRHTHPCSWVWLLLHACWHLQWMPLQHMHSPLSPPMCQVGLLGRIMYGVYSLHTYTHPCKTHETLDTQGWWVTPHLMRALCRPFCLSCSVK